MTNGNLILAGADAAMGYPRAGMIGFLTHIRHLAAIEVTALYHCRAGMADPKTFAALLPMRGIAPELAYVTAKFAALAPFGKVADLLSELLPISVAANSGTVRNRTLLVGETAARLGPASARCWNPMRSRRR